MNQQKLDSPAEEVSSFVGKIMAPNIQPPEEKRARYQQKLPGWIRWPIRIFLTPFVMIDIFMQKLARKVIQPPHRWTGTCKKRGACCHYILIEKAPGRLGRFYLWWNMEICGFYPRQQEPLVDGKKQYMVMGCRYLKGNKCGCYHLRPSICRKWPTLSHFGRPQVLRGCGFVPKLREKYKRG